MAGVGRINALVLLWFSVSCVEVRAGGYHVVLSFECVL